MDKITAEEITPGSPDEHLSVDIATIRSVAESARDLLRLGAPLPRYADLVTLAEGLRGMLRVLVQDLADRCPDEHSESVAPAVLEGLHHVRLPLGSGLQSAADATRNLADVTRNLCDHHEKVISA
ncbi:hypothetical protein HUT19_37765 [Streptomyces sp. NA02950]|uniref:DUF6415 family natural product biosynthesis protein n=1 Tax=Streptomyces sp. NA02950 TaxID=2742137 RepID=UPI0015916487|nr:DUF6415 family natural product biosynthesis protein [Streptomyces sp. NA02950]QKV96738.1 hypothetical protein HUT19_37765 [Streptomyces sp. NA02950]